MASSKTFIPEIPKSIETRAGLEKALANNIMFSHLEGDQLSKIFSAMFEVKYNASDIVFRQGRHSSFLSFLTSYTRIGDEGDRFFVLEQGECDVFTMKSGVSQHVAAYIAGSAFGELALIYGSPRMSTVKVTINCIISLQCTD